jgi:hypothetical protein
LQPRLNIATEYTRLRNSLYTPTDAHKLYKITSYSDTRSVRHVSAIVCDLPEHDNTKVTRSLGFYNIQFISESAVVLELLTTTLQATFAFTRRHAQGSISSHCYRLLYSEAQRYTATDSAVSRNLTHHQ